MFKKSSRDSVLRKKILISNTVFVAVLCLAFFVTFVAYYTKVNNEKLENNLEYVVETQINMFEQIIDMGRNISYSIRFTPEIIEIFRELNDGNPQNYFIQEPVLGYRLYDYTMFYLNQQDFISRICFYNEYGDFTYIGSSINMDNTVSYVSEERLEAIEEVLATDKIVYELHDTDELAKSGGNSGYISIIQHIMDYTLKNNNAYGYVEIQISYDLIYQQMANVSRNEYWEITLHEDAVNEEVLVFGYNHEKPVYTQETAVSNDNFHVYVSVFEDEGDPVLYITILILGSIIILIMLLVYYVQGRIVRRITEPLVQLCQNIQITDLENFEELNASEFDEVSELNETFAKMLQELQKAVDDLVVEKTSKMDAQILALQAQINPHFIHNTLALNNSLIEEGRLNQALNVSNHLSDMIRYSADFSQQMVPMEEELRHIRDYLELLKIKYEEDFKYSIQNECTNTTMDVPKFILQPMVENCIVHSLRETDFPWEIQIVCQEYQGQWRIKVEDGGIAIPMEKVEEIKKTYLDIAGMDIEELLAIIKIGGFSLINILIRMHFLYKGNIEFDIFSNDMGGTTVMIGGPIND
ncbi:MAG: histidine kinase [Eubacteriales bacterium]